MSFVHWVFVMSNDMRCESASIRIYFMVGEYQKGGRVCCFGSVPVINFWLYHYLDRGRASFLFVFYCVRCVDNKVVCISSHSTDIENRSTRCS